MSDARRTRTGLVALMALTAAVVTGIALNLPRAAPVTAVTPTSPAASPTHPVAEPAAPPARCASATATTGSGQAGATARVINVGFEDITNPTPGHLAELARRLDEVGATGVSIAAGRLDWIGFPWAGHESIESSDVADTGRDFLAEAIRALGCDGEGHPRQLILGIDVLLGRDMKTDPSLAGIDRSGQPSSLFASVTAWKSGPLKQRVADLAVELSHRYAPDAVNITELMFDQYTFGPDDEADFLATSGRKSWPLTADGEVDVHDPALEAWRTQAAVGVVAEVRRTLPAATQLTMDVRAPIDQSAHPRADIGQDYQALLRHVDRLNVWNFPGMSSTGTLTTDQLVPLLFEHSPSSYALELGLWSGAGIIPADVLARELKSAELAGLPAVSVTPASKMTDEVWSTIRSVWVGPPQGPGPHVEHP